MAAASSFYWPLLLYVLIAMRIQKELEWNDHILIFLVWS